MLAVDRISFSIKKGETLALVGESGSGKSATALSIMKLLPYPAASHPSGQHHVQGPAICSACREREIREMRGDDITIIFQEPMTSLNPLHTIERQIGEILLAASRPHRRARRARASSSCSTQVGIPNPRDAAEELSAPAVRRPAPARDDRDGARQRAGPADRRRADDRARRHRAGANPQASQGIAGPPRHGDAVHHPRPRHRAQDRRPGLRDEGRQDRRGEQRRRHLQVAAASLHARAARRRAAHAGRAAQSRPARSCSRPTT